MVRKTLTPNDEVAAKFRSEARGTVRSFLDVGSEAIRTGSAARHEAESVEPFRVEARDLGELRPSPSLDDVAEILDQVEGPLHR